MTDEEQSEDQAAIDAAVAETETYRSWIAKKIT
jgi:hypothetical protein